MKQGKKAEAEAAAAFKKLVSDYPGAKELAAKARKFVPSGLPLAPGYKVTLPIMAELGCGEIQLPIEVQGKEMVKVPAGEFECFKIHLGLVNQTFWYATDPHRYLVKFHAQGVDAELISISQNKPGEPRRYEDEKLGFSLAAPNDWYFYSAPPIDGKKHLAMVTLLDPQAV